MKIISTQDAMYAQHVLTEVRKRLLSKGQDNHAASLQRTIDALGGDSIHIADGAGQA